jgi:uncharacterized protein (TIGR03067 family)
MKRKRNFPSIHLLVLSSALCAAIPGLHAAEAEPGFKPLFNGKDLTGWNGNPKLWSVRDGAIMGVTGSDADTKINHNTFLVYTNGDVDDFELRFSYRIVAGNSGVQYRSKVTGQGAFGPKVAGYQADFEAGKTYSGILYDEGGGAGGRGIMGQRGEKVVWGEDCKKQVTGSLGDSKEIQAKIKHEDWNDYVIIANDHHLQHFINGQPTVDVTDDCEEKHVHEGVLALQIHTGPPMTVQFKNIRLKKLSGDAAKASDLQQMQGQWVPVEIMANGKALEADVLNAIKVTIHENSYKTERPNGVDEGTFKLDESATPRIMNLTSDSGREVPAIYEIAADTFKACYAVGNASRPTEFKSAEDSNHILVTYKRKTE